MLIRFFASDKPREINLARAFGKGVSKHGDRCEIRPRVAEPDISKCDAVCMVGVKSRKIFQQCVDQGVVPIMLDKGYIRDRRQDARVWEYWRVSIGSHHPTRFLTEPMSHKRFSGLGVETARWRRSGLQVVIAGSSAKYHEFYDLPDPTEWASDVVRQLRLFTDRPIIYRPKPSWREAVPIEGAYFSGGKENIVNVLTNAWAVVTHGSNTSFEAAIMGIPSIVLGDGIAKPISSTAIAAIEDPKLGDRAPWLNALAYWQWTESEMTKGTAWKFLRQKLLETKDAGIPWPP